MTIPQQRLRLWLLMLITSAGGLLETVCRGQSLPVVHHPQWLYYLAVSYTNSGWGNELVSPSGLDAILTYSNWANQPVLLGIGRRSHEYTVTNNLGNTNRTLFTLQVKPTIWSMAYGGKTFLTSTGAPPDQTLKFRAYQTVKGAVSISVSPDMVHWTSGYALLLTTDKNWTITRQ